jgi:hypothetical protein
MTYNSGPLGNQERLKLCLRRLNYLIHTEKRTLHFAYIEAIREGVLLSNSATQKLEIVGCRNLSRQRLFFRFLRSFELYYRIYKQVLSCTAYSSSELKDILKYTVRRLAIDEAYLKYRQKSVNDCLVLPRLGMLYYCQCRADAHHLPDWGQDPIIGNTEIWGYWIQ